MRKKSVKSKCQKGRQTSGNPGPGKEEIHKSKEKKGSKPRCNIYNILMRVIICEKQIVFSRNKRTEMISRVMTLSPLYM